MGRVSPEEEQRRNENSGDVDSPPIEVGTSFLKTASLAKSLVPWKFSIVSILPHMFHASLSESLLGGVTESIALVTAQKGRYS